MFQTTLPQFKKPEMSVVRQHEEFIWLHDRYVENEEYAGIIVSIWIIHMLWLFLYMILLQSPYFRLECAACVIWMRILNEIEIGYFP